MGNDTCCVAECGKPRRIRHRYCAMHFDRVKRHGSLRAPGGECRVSGCSNDVHRGGKRCELHKDSCIVTGCKSKSRGMAATCSRHGHLLRTTGSFKEPERIPDGCKKCPVCQQIKSKSEYSKSNRVKDNGTYYMCKVCHREYRAANRHKMEAWRTANRDRILAYNRMYEPRMLELVKARQSTIKSRTVPFTVEQLTARLSYFGNRCWICSGEAEHLDHVKPIKAGGWHMLANLRPACARCNRRKSSLWPISEADLQRIRQ